MSDDERRYTLDEAAQALSERKCAIQGHGWDVIETVGHGPIAILCDTCGLTYPVQREDGRPPGTAHETAHDDTRKAA